MGLPLQGARRVLSHSPGALEVETHVGLPNRQDTVFCTLRGPRCSSCTSSRMQGHHIPTHHSHHRE